ncbi:hypothetical protein DC498_04650 [Terrimonas sp.]|uniref:hypothetical protein n=1 Tax=Terrimonas sp. TaxID=1914338 RepID=UPI000D51EE80|nr:hypothetical protein [Terrimonas sp.]PVD53170.1 hypothetical protein DC498_04650 [Terrimonas sp.]
MSNYELLIKSLLQFPSEKWLSRYFDLVKKLLTDLDIDSNDPRLALTLPKNGILPVNLGQRYVFRPGNDGYVGCIVPIDFDTESVDGFEVFFFSTKGINDAKFIDIPMFENQPFCEYVYNACLEECHKILQHCKKSGFRKHHVSILYDFIMEPSVRSELLRDIF